MALFERKIDTEREEQAALTALEKTEKSLTEAGETNAADKAALVAKDAEIAKAEEADIQGVLSGGQRLNFKTLSAERDQLVTREARSSQALARATTVRDEARSGYAAAKDAHGAYLWAESKREVHDCLLAVGDAAKKLLAIQTRYPHRTRYSYFEVGLLILGQGGIIDALLASTAPETPRPAPMTGKDMIEIEFDRSWLGTTAGSSLGFTTRYAARERASFNKRISRQIVDLKFAHYVD